MKKLLIAAIAATFFANAFADSQARYVFYFIGDGMGMGHVNTTENYNRDVLKSENPILMLTFPVVSQARTFSANDPVTDSAASGTALSTGHKTLNGMIGQNPDSLDVESIAVKFRDNGYAVGVATSVAGDDATPAAFYAHAPYRGLKYVIAPQAATSGYEYLAGAVWRGMKDENGVDNGWVEMMKENGYTVSRGFQEYEANAASSPEKSLLLSANPAGDQVGYTLDSIPGALTLPQITRAGLRQLENSGKGKFFMMTEAGNIDWAAHANDGATVIKEILNFQEAIDVAYQFYLEHPEETLIVVTADHDTGGMAMGRKGGAKGYPLWIADYQKISKDRFSEYCKSRASDEGNPITWEEMKEFLTANFGFFGVVELSTEEENELHEVFNTCFVRHEGADEKTLYADYNFFSTKVLDMFNKKLNIGWTTSSHTGNPVPLFAIGAGSDLFKGGLSNHEVPMRILQAAGIK